MTTRTDVHRPTELKPADYSWVGYSDDGDANTDRLTDGPLFPPVQAPAADELRRESNPSRVRNAIHPGGCDACGQQGLRYRHYFRHDPTGDVIVLGDQCVARMDFDNAEGYKAARKVKAQREQEAMIAAAAAWSVDHREVVEFLTAVYEDEINVGSTVHFLMDVRAKLYQYGSLSEKQVAAVEKIMAKQAEFAAQRAEQDAETFEPIPTEIIGQRAEIVGEILSIKWRDSQFGGAFKMLVRDDRGFKVWGTAPAALTEIGNAADVRFADGTVKRLEGNALYNRPDDAEIIEGTEDEVVEKGDRVSFVARIEASDDDETFGFYKVPKKARRV